MVKYYVRFLFSGFLIIACLSQCKNESAAVKAVEETGSVIEQDSTTRDQLHFHVNIYAPIEKVYQTVIDSSSYSDWTTVFAPGSYFKGSWEEGSKIQLITKLEDGSETGMVSKIIKNVPNQLISLEHIGAYENGTEVYSGDLVESFKGAQEKYSFSTNGEVTTMVVNTDVFVENDSFFIKTWPLALNRIKALCEE